MLFNGEAGVVTALEADQVKIRFTASDACDSCGLKVVCAPGKESDRVLSLKNPGDLQMGQHVRVDEVSDLELHLALTQYGLPMLLFILGLLLGYYQPFSFGLRQELVAFLGAVTGLLISFPLVKSLIQKISDVVHEKYLRIIRDV